MRQRQMVDKPEIDPEIIFRQNLAHFSRSSLTTSSSETWEPEQFPR
jgi:hypothetical protein